MFRIVRNIVSGVTFFAKREAEAKYWEIFDQAWSIHFNAWN